MNNPVASLVQKIQTACDLVSDDDTELTLHNKWEAQAMLKELVWSDFQPYELMALCVLLARVNTRRLQRSKIFPGPGLRIVAS